MTDRPISVLDTGTSEVSNPPEGLEVCHQPALVRRALPLSKERIGELLSRRSHILFYSQFAAQLMLDQLSPHSDHPVWAVGQATADLLEASLGVPPNVPEEQDFEGLKSALSQASERLPIVAFGLEGQTRDLSALAQTWGVAFTPVAVYESRAATPETLRDACRRCRPQWLTVTSSRGARSLLEALGEDRLRGIKRAAIGPSTAGALHELGLPADLVAPRPDRYELLAAIATSTSTPQPPRERP